MLLYGFAYNLTIGATAYNIIAEVPTPRLRVKTVGMGISIQGAVYVRFPFSTSQNPKSDRCVDDVGICSPVHLQSKRSQPGRKNDIHFWGLMLPVRHLRMVLPARNRRTLI